MSKYRVDIKEQAKEDLAKLRKSEPAAHKLAVSLLLELMEHPHTSTGHPEQLKGDRSGQ